MMKSRLPAMIAENRALRFAVPAILLVAVFCAIDGREALAAILQADAGLILIALGLVQVQIIASAERWRFTARRLGQEIGRKEAIGEYYAASFANQVLPGGVAGDVLRAVRVSSGAGDRSGAITVRAIVLERFAGQIALFAIAAIGLAAWPLALAGPAPVAILAGPAALVLAVAAAIGIALRFAPRTMRRFIADFGPAIMAGYVRRLAWLRQGMMSLVIVASYIGVFGLAAAALDAPLPAIGLVTVVPLALLAMLVPISIGGWGVREASAAMLWGLIGISSTDGVATSLLYGLISLGGAAPGIVVLAMRRREHTAHEASASQSRA